MATGFVAACFFAAGFFATGFVAACFLATGFFATSFVAACFFTTGFFAAERVELDFLALVAARVAGAFFVMAAVFLAAVVLAAVFFGAAVLWAAARRVEAAAFGTLGVVTHPFDDTVRAFYQRWGFVDLAFDPKRAMIVRISDLVKAGIVD